MTPGPPTRLPLAARWALLLLLAGAALALGAVAWQRNFNGACERDEWPHLSSCPKADPAPASQVRDLRQRAARNPGDATSYLALALLTTQPGGVAPLDDEAVLAVTGQLAGKDALYQRVMATRAVQRQQWPQAVQWLVSLVDNHRDPAAAQTLAALMALPDAQAAVVAALQPQSRWVQPLLLALPAARVPVQQALPLLAPALALQLVTPEQGLAFVSQLKAAGHWLDAQALWLHLLRQPTPLIYNGGFENGFLRGGFDWDLPDAPPVHTGVQVRQEPVAGAQGRALELAFNGRRLALPVISQHLVLFPGAYTFTGRYKSQRLRAGAGITWVFTCTAGGAELARTTPLTDSKGAWQSLSLQITVPEACGAVSMQLRTHLGSDALSGVQGVAWFDDLRLSSL